MKRAIAIALLLLVPTAEAGDQTEAEKLATLPVVRLRQVYKFLGPDGWSNVENTRVQSGCLIWRYGDGTGDILTCAHGLREEGPVHLLLSPNDLEWGRITAIDHNRDLAIVHCKIVSWMQPLPMEATAPQSANAAIVGFGGEWWDKGFGARRCTIVGKSENPGFVTSRFDAGTNVTRGGDSGGPLLVSRHVVGVHVKGSNATALAVPIEDVHKFLVDKAGWKPKR